MKNIGESPLQVCLQINTTIIINFLLLYQFAMKFFSPNLVTYKKTFFKWRNTIENFITGNCIQNLLQRFKKKPTNDWCLLCKEVMTLNIWPWSTKSFFTSFNSGFNMTSICVLNDMTDADTDKQMNKIQQG